MSGKAESSFRAEGLRRLESARAAIARARALFEQGDQQKAEQVARSSLATFRGATNYLEDHPEFEVAHREMDIAGRWTRESLGCQLGQNGTQYTQSCPVALAHVRVGFSPAIVTGFIRCSICWGDASECPHLNWEEYQDVECHKTSDICNICERGGDCPHVEGEVYEAASCFHIVEEIRAVREVSFVSRPSQPDARIEVMAVPHSDLREALGPAWKPGMPVSCDRCLSDCEGVSDPFASH